MPKTSHTTDRASVAARYVPTTGEFLTASDFDLNAEASETWCQITDDQITALRKRAGLTSWRWMIDRLRRTEDRPPCMLVHAARLIIWLAGPGKVSEAKLLLVPMFLQRVIERCCAGSAQRSLTCIDREEVRLDGRENELTSDRRIADAEGREVPVEALLEEARVNEAEATLHLERARALRRRARTIALRSSAPMRQAAV